MSRRELPLCSCKAIKSSNPNSQISKTLDSYVRMLSQLNVPTPDIIDVYAYGVQWFKQMLEHNDYKEWMYKNEDGYNEYHTDLQLPRYRVSFHLTVET